ncbi:MAG: ABC transporter permease [Acidobacteriia bacterium]|nr:ABC transporter permease [Terriglobia bacterium]
MLESLIRDFRYGARSLLRARGFAATVILTLSVCIGVNAAIFAIINSVLLRPLPVPESDAILLMANQYPKAGVGDLTNSSSGDYYDRLQAITAFQQQAMFRFTGQTINATGTPERVSGMAVTPSLFGLLRVHPAVGRVFAEQEGEIGAEQKVILSYGMWQQLYAGDSKAMGSELRLNGRPFTIVGVMPRGFVFINPEVRLWTPLAFKPEEKTVHHSNNFFNIGRLKPGASLKQVQAQVDALNLANLDRMPQLKEALINAGFHTKVEPLQDLLVNDVKSTLYLLWGGAAFVLLIGGLNIANLALARLTLRKKELATRLALGARSLQLMRQFVVENLIMAMMGGVAGLLLGAALLRLLAVIGLDHFPRAYEVSIHGQVILVVLAMAAGVSLLISLIPFATVFHGGINPVLHDDSRTGTGGKGARRVRRGLVVAQIGFAFALLVGAGLLLASFRQLLKVDPGFRTDSVVTAAVNAPASRYAGAPELRALMDRALDAIRRIPGVVSAGATTTMPFSGDYSDSVILAEGHVMKPGESLVSPRQVTVTPGYFETMGISLVKGRLFQASDNEAAPRVVIVDERLARHFWPDRDPIGLRMYFPADSGNLTAIDEHTVWLRVVGVARSVRLEDLAAESKTVGAYYFPFAQDTSRGFGLAVRAAGDTGTVANEVRSAMAGIDPELALFNVKTMAEMTQLSLASRRTSMMLALAFGVLALFLAALGIYGVLAYLVTQRRREIGIRIALGSTQGGIVKLVMREALALVGTGLALGIAGALALRTAVASQIYGVRPLDPLVMGSVIVLLGTVALVACAVPARRAVLVNPVAVLSE